jgi:flagellar protein FliS
MSYGNALKSYQNTSIKTADTIQLVILCYERAIKDLNIAKQLHENDALEDGYKSIRHAQDIITELLLGLDYDRGGEISTNLSKIYNFMLRELMGINSSKDTVVYGHIIRMLAELKDAWEQVRKSALQVPSVSVESELRNWQAMA